MALSNALPNSVLKPGVCTSSTRPSNPYEGQFIYETDTDSILFYNGSSWVTPGSSSSPSGSNDFTRKGYVDSQISTVSSAASAAQATADSAATAASNANTNANTRLARSGGTMTGALNMGNQPIFLRTSNDVNHYVHYDSNIDGATMAGWSGCRIYITSNGTTYDFKSNGTAIAPNQWYSSSSVKYKENICVLDAEKVSETIDMLEPVSFSYKRDHIPTEDNSIGFIAEQVAEVMPELVEYDEDGNPDAVAYSLFAVLAVTEIKELRKRLASIEKRLDELA